MMMRSEFTVGQVVPATPMRGVTHGARLPKAVWHALCVAPGKEAAASKTLKAAGVYSFYPTEDRVYVVRGEKITRSYPTVTRIIYARFRHAPQWDVMRERKIITGVFCRGTDPIALPGDVIRIVQGLPTTAERIAAARAELLAIHPGDQAQIASGPMAGFAVDVMQVVDGRAWWQTVTGIKGSSAVGMLSKVMQQDIA